MKTHKTFNKAQDTIGRLEGNEGLSNRQDAEDKRRKIQGANLPVNPDQSSDRSTYTPGIEYSNPIVVVSSPSVSDDESLPSSPREFARSSKNSRPDEPNHDQTRMDISIKRKSPLSSPLHPSKRRRVWAQTGHQDFALQHANVAAGTKKSKTAQTEGKDPGQSPFRHPGYPASSHEHNQDYRSQTFIENAPSLDDLYSVSHRSRDPSQVSSVGLGTGAENISAPAEGYQSPSGILNLETTAKEALISSEALQKAQNLSMNRKNQDLISFGILETQNGRPSWVNWPDVTLGQLTIDQLFKRVESVTGDAACETIDARLETSIEMFTFKVEKRGRTHFNLMKAMMIRKVSPRFTDWESTHPYSELWLSPCLGHSAVG